MNFPIYLILLKFVTKSFSYNHQYSFDSLFIASAAVAGLSKKGGCRMQFCRNKLVFLGGGAASKPLASPPYPAFKSGEQFQSEVVEREKGSLP